MDFFKSNFLCMSHLLLMVLLAWSSSIFKIILTLRIQRMALFNSTNCVPMWPSIASLGLWFKFLGLISSQFWLSLLVAFHFIAVGETLYWLMNRVLCLQFCDVFVFHLSPYQFEVVVGGGYEVVLHGIWATLDAHLDWVVLHVDIANAFNTISRKTIFQELRATRGLIVTTFLFVRSFYGLHVPLYFNHHSSSRALFVILFSMGTCQGDPLVGPFFTFVHFCTLHYFSRVFPSCLFPSLASDTHIFGPTHVISFAFNHFASQLAFIGLYVQPHKCSAQVLSSFLPRFVPPAKFCCPPCGIRILGVPFDYASFISFLWQEVLIENVWHATVFPKLGDVQVAFGIFS